MQLGFSLSVIARALGGAAVPVTGDPIALSVVGAANAVQGVTVGDGWWIEPTFKGVSAGGTISPTPDATPKGVLTVTSPGYDASGNLGTINRSIKLTAGVKDSYPLHANDLARASGSDLVVPMAAEDYIYVGDTISQAAFLSAFYTGTNSKTLTGNLTNGSSVAYPKVLADWADVPKQDWTGDLTLEVLAAHKFGRGGTPVACVKITGTDGTNTVTKTSAYAKSAKYGDNLPVYGATFNVSEFIAGQDVSFTFVAYPWVGSAAAVRDTSGATFPSAAAAAPQVHRCGAISSLKYVYVLTTGNDGTGAVGTTRAGAKATPFLTVLAAVNALYAAKSDLSQCVVYLGAGTFTWPTAAPTGATRTALHGWFRLEGDPDDADPYTNCILQTASTTYWQPFNNGAGTMSYCELRNLSVTVAAANQGFFNGGGSRATLWLNHVKLTNNLTAATVWSSGAFVYVTQCDGTGGNAAALLFSASSTNCRLHMVRASTTNRLVKANVLASTVIDASGITANALALGLITNLRATNCVAVNCRVNGWAGTTGGCVSLADDTVKVAEMALVQCLFEAAAGATQPLLALGENVVLDTENVLIDYITTVGGTAAGALRLNVHNDPTTNPTTAVSDQCVYTDTAVKRSIIKWIAVKDDYFHGNNEADSGAKYLVKGWPKRYGVGWQDNVSPYSPDDFAPQYFGVNSARAAAVTYDGGYRPTSGARTVASQALTWDLNGVARRTDGTGVCGALESA